ncbi:MAG: thiamine-phosphate kinase [Endomicrobium sp.]|jgi:thiamine-monophosphate kinase|nr:thiamine-phosphate kinase [Endomicrobium sp.]
MRITINGLSCDILIIDRLVIDFYYIKIDIIIIMKNKNISKIGEFGLIDRIKTQFTNISTDRNITANIGDDSFCFKSGKNNICITKDMLVEEVHFKKEWISPQELGKKSIEVNVCDIAAMGNIIPKYVFIGLGVPSKTPEMFINNLYKGFKKTCDKYKIAIAGGDIVKSDRIVISVTLVGMGKQEVIKRNSAEEGDLIGVTNTFGDAGAGITLLYKHGIKYKYNKAQRYLILKQNNPKARLKEAWKISEYLTSLTDASDGLYISVNLLAKDSKKGAEINMNKIPISSNLKKVFKEDKEQLNFALFGAEDYELVFTVPDLKAELLKKLIPKISYIGVINSSNEIRYFYNGKEQKIKYSGYKHF